MDFCFRKRRLAYSTAFLRGHFSSLKKALSEFRNIVTVIIQVAKFSE